MTDQGSVLIVFVKNPRPGKVKTRLAESVGEEKALRIYRILLDYTKSVVRPLEVKIQVWFSDRIPENDFWEDLDIQKKIQAEGDLGERMAHACEAAFSKGFEKTVIIGSDCAELTTEILNRAYDALEQKDVVIGPSVDGGYYLIGMNSFHGELFVDKPWSRPDLFRQTIEDIESRGLSYSLLERLNDVDTGEDWDRVKDYFSE